MRSSETAFTDGAYVSSATIDSVTHSDFVETPAESGRFSRDRFVVEVVTPRCAVPTRPRPPP